MAAIQSQSSTLTGSEGEASYSRSVLAPFANKVGVAKVDRLLAELNNNIDSAKLSLKETEALLAELKVLGRNPSTAAPLFTEGGIKVLGVYGFDHEKSLASLEALRCLANALLLHQSSRQTLVDLGFAPKAAERLKFDDRDHEFVLSRILFLLSYDTKLDFESLIHNNHLDDTINQNLSRHAKLFSSKSGRRKSDTSPIVDMSLVETLKLTFNISHFYPDLKDKFTPSIESLVTLILNHPLPNPPLQSPIIYIVNALFNLNLAGAEKKTPLGPQKRCSPLFPYTKPEAVAQRLTLVLNKAIINHDEKELDQAAASLVTLIRRLYNMAYPQMKEWMQCVMLPRESDRDKPLGQSDTLASRLLRCSCSPNLPTLRENISGLLFELSGSDANQFVSNIGYGFASGFLMSHSIEIPASAKEANSLSTDASDGSAAPSVNPITGQLKSAEDRDQSKREMEEMTEEEKEREAERLFVLFERLKATGVVDVKNPVQQAMEDGRFEELD